MSIDQDNIEQELEKVRDELRNLLLAENPKAFDWAAGRTLGSNYQSMVDIACGVILTARRENAELTRKNKYFVWLNRRLEIKREEFGWLKKQMHPLKADIARLRQERDEFAKAYDKYIALLGEELDELIPLATSHGWKSTRFEVGKALRERIAVLKAQAKEGT